GMHQISMGGQHMRTSTRPEGAYTCVPPSHVKAFPELLRGEGYFTFNTTKLDYQFSGTMPGSGPFTIWDEENNAKMWRNKQTAQPFFGMVNFMVTHESGVFTPLGHRPNSLMHFLLQVYRWLSLPEYEDLPKTDPAKVDLPPYYPDQPAIRQDVARHYDNIASMDAEVGNILDKLKKDGLMESTIIIWTTDHGDGLPRAKRELYDSGIKVPMIIYYPPAFSPANVEVGGVDERLISFVDLVPTILSVAETPLPDFLQGKSLLDTTNTFDQIFASRDRIDEVMDRQRAIRTNRYKYIRSWYPEQEGGHKLAFRDNMEMMQEMWKLKEKGELSPEQLLWFQGPGEESLFDLENDPYEIIDLSKDTSYTVVLDSMRNALGSWLSSVEDWSDTPENEMVAQFQANGETPVTPAPELSIVKGQLDVAGIEGASIGYKIEDGPWQLYTSPIPYSLDGKITVKAVRYGWEESEEVEVIPENILIK
ncbi:MAG: sulfatase, partial [Bacteroidota bacterium]